MKKKLLAVAAVAVLTLLVGGVGQAKADQTAVTLTGYNLYTNGGWTLGFEFSPTVNIDVTALGSFFPGGATDTHGVTLWDATGHVLATTTVTGNGTQGIDYTAIAPVLLTAGTNYFVGATTLADNYADNGATWTVNPDINYIAHAEIQTAGVTPQFPTNTYTNFGDFGADFMFTPVPEPASLALLGIGAMGLIGYGLRRRKTAAVAAN